MNYAELVELVQDYMESREPSFVDNIPRFVRQAEQRIYRTIMLPELRKSDTLTTTSSDPYLDRPTDFLSVFSMAVVNGAGEYLFLTDKDVSFIREAFPSPTITGVPVYYAQFDGVTPLSPGRFMLAPTPDDAYSVELNYYYDPPSIVDEGTSWLGENAETALLYGSLLESYAYLKGEADLLAQYKDRYTEAMGQLTGIDVRAQRDDFRDGQIRKGK
jgi:hypothetical protein